MSTPCRTVTTTMPEVLDDQDWAEVGRLAWIGAAEQAGAEPREVSADGAGEARTFGTVVDERGDRLVLRFRESDEQVVAEPVDS
ncbi:MAG: hypothetical protein HYX34_16180 [Actinobacteria bacterium]|nr:hypothetical protein [Actinomycetota bacterium]